MAILQKHHFVTILLWITILLLSGCNNINYPDSDLYSGSSIQSGSYIQSGYSSQSSRPIPTEEIPKPKPIKNIQVALALGTGGVRGIAHLGVIEVLEKEGIPIDLIVGSSAGSLIGAFYSDTPKVALIKDKILHIRKENLLDSSFFLPLSGHNLEKFVRQNIGCKSMEELKIPLIAVATNLNNNHVALLRTGPIAKVVHASSAMPHIFAPVMLYNQTFVDGGVLEAVPVQAARVYKPKMIIAVNVIPEPVTTTPVRKFKQVFERSIDLSYYAFSEMQANQADIHIHPDLTNFETFNDQCNEAIFERGRQAALLLLPKIKSEMALRGIKPRRNR